MRGTMVSTFPLHPSKLPVSCVRDWGMPNRNGVLTVDRTVLHITYDRTDTNLIHVYARRPDPPRPSTGYSLISLSPDILKSMSINIMLLGPPV